MKRFPRLRKFLLRGFLILLVPLAGWAFENWRGARAWEEAQARAEKAGVSLLRADYAGPEIPDEENLFKDLVFLREFENEGEDKLVSWRRLPEVDWRGLDTRNNPATGEVLKFAEYFKEELSEENARVRLANAAEEIEVRLDALSKAILSKPVHSIFADSECHGPLMDINTGIMQMQNFAACLESSASMALRSGDSAKALERIRALDRWVKSTVKPSLINLLVGNAIDAVNYRPIWDGIRLRLWSDADLATLSDLLGERDIKGDFQGVIRFEAAFGVETFDHLEALKERMESFEGEMSFEEKIQFWFSFGGPSGWQGQRKALLVNRYLDFINAMEGSSWIDEEELVRDLPTGRFSPLGVVGEEIRSVVSSQTQGYKASETRRRIAMTGIALERYFLAREKYPKALADLGMKTPVIDLTDPKGRELIYELGPDGRPVIFSEYEEETEKRISRRKLRWQYYEQVEVPARESQVKRRRGK